MNVARLRGSRFAGITVALVVLLALGAFVGAIGRPAAAQDQTEVRLTGFSTSPEEIDLLEQVLAGFSEAHPEIQVTYEPVSGNYLVKLLTDLAAGNAADVFYVQIEFAQDFMSRGLLMPLDDFMAESGMSADEFYPGLVQAFQWDGVQYGLPKDWSPLGMIYNMQMFEDAGITAAPTTWEELRTTAQTLKDNGVEYPIAFGPQFDRYIAFLYQAGGNVVNEDVTEVTIDSPEALEAMEFYYGLYADGLAASASDIGAGWNGEAMATGQAAITFEGNWIFPTLASATDMEFGVAEMPAGPAGQGTAAFTVAYSMSKDTEVADAAWTLLSYLTGPEGMGTWTSLGLAMPARPDLAEEWVATFPEREPFLASGDYATAVQYGPGGQQFSTDAQAIMESLFAGSITPEEAVTQLGEKARADLTLREAGAEGTPSS